MSVFGAAGAGGLILALAAGRRTLSPRRGDLILTVRTELEVERFQPRIVAEAVHAVWNQ